MAGRLSVIRTDECHPEFGASPALPVFFVYFVNFVFMIFCLLGRLTVDRLLDEERPCEGSAV